MKKLRTHARYILLVSFALILITVGMGFHYSSYDAAGTGYSITWWTNDSGSTISNSQSVYSLSASSGQPDAGMLVMDEYILVGGFWPVTQIRGTQMRLYFPLVLQSAP